LWAAGESIVPLENTLAKRGAETLQFDREEAIRRARALIESSGGRVVPSLIGLVNLRDDWITTLQDCRLEDGRWVLLFLNLDPPGVVTSPGCSIVLVGAASGETEFFPVM
jgi:hypothetical protein